MKFSWPKRYHWFALFALGSALILFFYLAQEMVETPSGDAKINALDNSIRDFVISKRAPGLDDILVAFTYMGSTVTVTFVAIVSFVFLRFRGRVSDQRLILLSGIAIACATRLAKTLIHRQRPAPELWLVPADHSSFPSGHSAGAFAVYGILFFVLSRNCDFLWQRITMLVIGGLVVGVIGFSRIYLGVHFPSDVIGGFALGMVVSLCAVTVDAILKDNSSTP